MKWGKVLVVFLSNNQDFFIVVFCCLWLGKVSTNERRRFLPLVKIENEAWWLTVGFWYPDAWHGVISVYSIIFFCKFKIWTVSNIAFSYESNSVQTYYQYSILWWKQLDWNLLSHPYYQFGPMWYVYSWPLFTKRMDILPLNLVKHRNSEIVCYTDGIALQFDRHLGSTAANVPVKCQSNWKILNPSLAALRLDEILR